MKILMNTGGVARTNAFVIADENAKEAVLFDAPDHTVAMLLDEVEKNEWQLIGLWLTHGHYDHLADHAEVKRRFPESRLLIHPMEEPRLRDPQSRMFDLPFEIPSGAPDGYVKDGDVLRLGSIEVRVLHTPGHSPGHVMYHLPNEKVLVGGDLIICGAVGRTDLPGGDPSLLNESIRKIMKLPRETQLLPGHCEPTTLGQERQSNSYVQLILGEK